MGFTLTYKTLFEVKLLHHYFLNKAGDLFDNMTAAEKSIVLKGYDLRDFISIEPTADCARVLSRYHLIYKNTPSGLIVGTRANQNAGKFFPAFSVEDSLRFTFKVYFEDTFFSNYTALPLSKDRAAMYYFQNRKTNSLKKFPHLTQFAAAFTGGETYSSGEILSDNAAAPTKLFIAKKISTNAPPHADWINDDLVVGKPLQYATRKDLLPIYTDSIRYNTNETNLTLTVSIKNRSGDTITPKFATVTENDKSVALVDIHFLPEDFYTIKLEDAGKPYSKEFSFYRLSAPSNADALIDIIVKSDDAAFNILAGDGSLLEPIYELRFKNRSTVWRYLGEEFTNLPVSGPHPLTKKGLVPVTVANKDGDPIADMPNPNVNMIKTEHPALDNTHYEVISEIYIH